uniref:uncharacterized protein LOC132674666 n=1 Tax=Panthera onca TaxID=9690 RepID=UPI00295569EF|nr:uncharacterized protein LOC132674666 [Panthera onca]
MKHCLGCCQSHDVQLRRSSEGVMKLSRQGERKAGSEELALTRTHTLTPSIVFPPLQPVTVITGGPTAAAGASAKTGLCATPSRGLATVLQVSGAGAARTAASRAPTVMTVASDASVRMEPPVTTSRGNAAARRDTLEPSVRIFVPPASTAHSVSRDAPAKMEEYVITSPENALALLAGWAQCVVSLALRVALERTVHKNVSAIMEGRVTLPQASVIAAQDTQGNGKG